MIPKLTGLMVAIALRASIDPTLAACVKVGVICSVPSLLLPWLRSSPTRRWRMRLALLGSPHKQPLWAGPFSNRARARNTFGRLTLTIIILLSLCNTFKICGGILLMSRQEVSRLVLLQQSLQLRISYPGLGFPLLRLRRLCLEVVEIVVVAVAGGLGVGVVVVRIGVRDDSFRGLLQGDSEVPALKVTFPRPVMRTSLRNRPSRCCHIFLKSS
jgi:hypothetical protein